MLVDTLNHWQLYKFSNCRWKFWVLHYIKSYGNTIMSRVWTTNRRYMKKVGLIHSRSFAGELSVSLDQTDWYNPRCTKIVMVIFLRITSYWCVRVQKCVNMLAYFDIFSLLVMIWTYDIYLKWWHDSHVYILYDLIEFEANVIFFDK